MGVSPRLKTDRRCSILHFLSPSSKGNELFNSLSASFQKGNSSSSSFFAVEARRKDNRLGAALTSIEKRGTLFFSYKLSNEFNSPLFFLPFILLLFFFFPLRTVGSGERIKSRTQRERECSNKRGGGGGGGAVRDESRGAQTSLPSYTKQKRKKKKNQGFSLGFILNIF